MNYVQLFIRFYKWILMLLNREKIDFLDICFFCCFLNESQYDLLTQFKAEKNQLFILIILSIVFSKENKLKRYFFLDQTIIHIMKNQFQLVKYIKILQFNNYSNWLLWNIQMIIIINIRGKHSTFQQTILSKINISFEIN